MSGIPVIPPPVDPAPLWTLLQTLKGFGKANPTAASEDQDTTNAEESVASNQQEYSTNFKNALNKFVKNKKQLSPK